MNECCSDLGVLYTMNEEQLLQQEMETDEDHATMRESFSLVQNILFIDYSDVIWMNTSGPPPVWTVK